MPPPHRVEPTSDIRADARRRTVLGKGYQRDRDIQALG
jgi:hypothetical protein